MNKAYSKWLKIEDKKIIEELSAMSEEKINSCFNEPLSFGTSGIRGVMELGTSRLNVINVCKLATAVSSYCQTNNLSKIIIGFDTRNNSKTFSRIFAKVLAQNGINVELFKNFVPTPVLAYSVKKTNSDLGIMITASHNSKEYNGIKVFGNDGILISGSIEKTINSLYQKTDEILAYNNMLSNDVAFTKKINMQGRKLSKKFLGNFYKNKINNELNIIYTPLNGTACKYVVKALKGTGFSSLRIPFCQKFANGNFKTCPSPNPEYVEVYKRSLKLTETFDADVIVATDPDGDRFGAMIKSTKGYRLLTGNEVGFLLLNYIYENRIREKNTLAVATVVSSPMFFNMCDFYNIKYEKTLTGFKNVGRAKLKLESKYSKDGFLLAYEESCGYIVKDEFYDKDGIFALLKFCELASYLKNKGSSVEEYLNSIYAKFGNIYSLNSNIVFDGDDAMKRINEVINNLRTKKLTKLNKKKIIESTDYLNDKTGYEKANFLEYKTSDFSFVIRPSGTEPKLKFYIHAQGKNLEASKKLANEVLTAIKKEILNINE